MRITLKVTAGPHKGRAFAFVGHDTFLVGRSKRAHFRLPVKDKYFSRVHFLVEVNPPQCCLMDMGSRNGTYVNGKKVTRADLHDGDRIRAGHTLLRISLEETETCPDVAAVSLLPGKAALPTTIPPPPVAPPPVPPPSEAIPLPSSGRPPRARSTSPPAAVCLACSAPLANPEAPPSLLCPACSAQAERQPQLIRGLQIVRQLGKGAMGLVYLAIHTARARVVAVKTIIPAVSVTKDAVVRFFREACILKELQHPNIVAFHDMGEAKGRLYFVMDYVPGIDAARLLKREGPLPVGRAVGLVCQLLEALTHAHRKGFVHRDIKPHNMLIIEEGGCDTVKLADFGLARVYQTSQLSGLSLMGDLGGTVAFIAPEQITNFREARPPADQYSSAATLYTLLTNKYVFDLPSQQEQQLLMILEGEPVPIHSRREDIPAALSAVIHRALAKAPEGRFPDVTSFRKALLRFCR